MKKQYSDQRTRLDRREVLRCGGLCIAGALMPNSSQATEDNPKMFMGLTRDSAFDIGEQGTAIIHRAYQLGYDYEAKHGGCCRCTVAALQQAVGFIPEDKGLFRTASCLDGGATAGGIQNCGAFTGAGMVIGWICAVDGFGDTSLSHRLIRKVSEKFEKAYGSVLCRDVRKGVENNCPDAVGKAARWTAEILLSQFSNYNPKK